MGKKRKASSLNSTADAEKTTELPDVVLVDEDNLPTESAVAPRKRKKPLNKAPKKEEDDEEKTVKKEADVVDKSKRKVAFADQVAKTATKTEIVDDQPVVGFDSFGLDDRILKALGMLGWSSPTVVQAQFIPLALDGKDVLARARTGTGKTAAFAIPVLHRILQAKSGGGGDRGRQQQRIRCLVLAPTKELCAQVAAHIAAIKQCCQRDVAVLDIAAVDDYKSRRALLTELPDIVVSTPSRLLPHLIAEDEKQTGYLTKLEFLVMDEADLMFSFGYEKDMKKVVSQLATGYQCLVTSATLNEDVKQLKQLTMHNPVTLKLEESMLASSSQLTQYIVKCDAEEKFVLIYALIKLRLLRGKSIIFVNDTDRCYRLRLFLEQFGVGGCVLNAEMPANSRCHIVHQFNNDQYPVIIASDDTTDAAPPPPTTTDGGKKPPPRIKRRRRNDKESGVSRGIDFHRVSNVINFDFPTSVDSYVHRVGRTARGNNRGTALSFTTDDDQKMLKQVEEVLSEQMGSNVLRPYEFRMEELDGFRYRARDVLRAITHTAVREARLQEIKQELLRSKKLESYFTTNPTELSALRHDKALHGVRNQPHLKHIPEYIVPPTLRGVDYSATDEFSAKKLRKRKPVKQKPHTHTKRRFSKKKTDPLKTFTI